MSAELKVKNIGPVEELEASLPEGGAITMLVGPNDSGKTVVLESVGKCCGGSQTVTKREGSLHGEMSVFGTTLKVTGRPRLLGDLTVDTIEGKFDISDLIDPSVKDPAKADAVRIKAMLAIKDAGVSIDALKAVVGEKFASLITTKVTQADNLPDGVAILKRGLQEAARDSETEATNLTGQATAKRATADGVDMDAESDASTLQESLESAIRHNATVKQQIVSAREAKQTRLDTQATLNAALSAHEGPTVEAAVAAVTSAGTVLDNAQDRLAAAKKQLSIAETDTAECKRLYDTAVDRRTVAVEHDANIGLLRSAIADAGKLPDPGEAAVEAATKAVDAARIASDEGVRIRDAKQATTEAETCITHAETHTKEAKQLRDRAGELDKVLTDAIQSKNIFAVTDSKGNTRLATNVPQRGQVYFHERSRGTRASMAVDEAIGSMEAGKRSLILLRQDLWEGLDEDNRASLDSHCRERGVNILTAEASRVAGEKLHAVVWKAK